MSKCGGGHFSRQDNKMLLCKPWMFMASLYWRKKSVQGKPSIKVHKWRNNLIQALFKINLARPSETCAFDVDVNTKPHVFTRVAADRNGLPC